MLSFKVEELHEPLDLNNNNKFTLGKSSEGEITADYIQVDRGKDGNCLFKAILDHLLPFASNEQLDVLAIKLRQLVVQQERIEATIDDARVAEGYDGRFNMRRTELQKKSLLARASAMENPGEIGGDLEIVILSWMFNVDIVVDYSISPHQEPKPDKSLSQDGLWYDKVQLLFNERPLPIDVIRIRALTPTHYVALRNKGQSIKVYPDEWLTDDIIKAKLAIRVIKLMYSLLLTEKPRIDKHYLRVAPGTVRGFVSSALMGFNFSNAGINPTAIENTINMLHDAIKYYRSRKLSLMMISEAMCLDFSGIDTQQKLDERISSIRNSVAQAQQDYYAENSPKELRRVRWEARYAREYNREVCLLRYTPALDNKRLQEQQQRNLVEQTLPQEQYSLEQRLAELRLDEQEQSKKHKLCL